MSSHSYTPDKIIPELARSPLIKTTDRHPIFIGQIYRKSFGKARTTALIIGIENSDDNRHASTLHRWPHSLPYSARIKYLIHYLDTPNVNATDTRAYLKINVRNFATFGDFVREYSYLCYCPVTFPYGVTDGENKRHINEAPELFEPNSDRIKQLERVRNKRFT